MILNGCEIIMKRNHFLDVLKGICILFICSTHYDFTDWNRLDFFFPFWVDTAVPLFMLISGYVGTASYRRRNVTTIEEAYALPIILNKLCRYTVPYFMAWLVEFGYKLKVGGIHNINPYFLFIHFVRGGDGPGAYYFPLMIQLVFVFPLIYFLIKNWGFLGVFVSFFATYAMEIAKTAYQMTEQTYCSLLFRYIFIIAVGVYLASEKYTVHREWEIIAFIAGIVFLVLTEYYGFFFLYIDFWSKTSLFGCLYIAPLAALGIRRLGELKIPPLELLGRASYNIFLVQKVYYINGRKFYALIPGVVPDYLVSVAVCVLVGLLFYYVSEPITKWCCKKVQSWAEKVQIPESWF